MRFHDDSLLVSSLGFDQIHQQLASRSLPMLNLSLMSLLIQRSQSLSCNNLRMTMRQRSSGAEAFVAKHGQALILVRFCQMLYTLTPREKNLCDFRMRKIGET